MSLYAITYTNDRGQPQLYYFRADAYDPEYRRLVERDPTPDVALAAKWTTVADAVTAATQHRDLGNPDAEGLNDWWAVVGIPGYLQAAAEMAAVHAWNHRDCHRENGEGRVAMPDDFDRWLGFTFRSSGDRLVIQVDASHTTRLTREQADRLVSHLAEVAHTLPPLWMRLGMDAPFPPKED